MSKVLPASCVAGVVLAGGLPLADATVLAEGVAPSEGFAVIDEDQVFYVAKTTPDLLTTLDNLSSALDQISQALTHAATALTAHDGIVGPVAAADIAAIVTAVTAIGLVKTAVDLHAEALL